MKKRMYLAVRLILLCSFFCVSVPDIRAQITLSVSDKTIKDVIEIIEKQDGYSFFYSDKLLGLEQKVTIKINNESMESVLNKLFTNTDIGYKIEPGNQVVLSTKARVGSAVATQTKKTTGIVTDKAGNPLIGVTIAVDGIPHGTVSDIDGSYTLDVPIGAFLNFRM